MKRRECKMQITKCKLHLVSVCVFALIANRAVSAEPFSFDDIRFWVGSGTNRAALVIDWVEDSTEPPALTWGHRWDGTARGSDMLIAVVAADPRLFAKLGGTPANPNAVFGLGYDADNDGEFGIDDGTTFDMDGIAFSGPADGAVATDPGDYYAEGWFTGFWHYGVAPSNPYNGGIWTDSPVGMAGRMLADGSWDSWAFTPTFDFSAFAENPIAALPPTLPGDFNNDGRVDHDDYNLWRSTFGSMSQLEADANRSGVVDAADYVIWRQNLSPAAGQPTFAAMNVPEPAAIVLAIGALAAAWCRRRLRRGERDSCSTVCRSLT